MNGVSRSCVRATLDACAPVELRAVHTLSGFEAKGPWLRCALHAHTTNSDGEASPAALAAHYERAGYDVLCITDHWVRTVEAARAGMFVLPGVELNATRVFSLSRIRKAWSVYVFALASISSRDSAGRVTFRPVGSPISPVKSPITKMM